MRNNAQSSRGKLDFSTIGGIVLAFVGVVGGLILEGGRFSDIASFSAAMIVLAGTFGALMITTPLHQLLSAGRKLPTLVFDSTPSNAAAIDQVLLYARQARRGGLPSLDSEVEKLTDPFLKKALMLAVDGADIQDIRQIMELEIELAEHWGECDAKVFETAGGYSPTIGIIGAVLGLIQVMKHLEDIDRVGHGIAVAFVATVYGVAFANLFLIPAGAKLRARLESKIKNQELLLEGILCLAEGMNPTMIQRKLEAYRESAPDSRMKPGEVSSPAQNRPAA